MRPSNTSARHRTARSAICGSTAPPCRRRRPRLPARHQRRCQGGWAGQRQGGVRAGGQLHPAVQRVHQQQLCGAARRGGEPVTAGGGWAGTGPHRRRCCCCLVAWLPHVHPWRKGEGPASHARASECLCPPPTQVGRTTLYMPLGLQAIYGDATGWAFGGGFVG